jgi:hypothetical protein
MPGLRQAARPPGQPIKMNRDIFSPNQTLRFRSREPFIDPGQGFVGSGRVTGKVVASRLNPGVLLPMPRRTHESLRKDYAEKPPGRALIKIRPFASCRISQDF